MRILLLSEIFPPQNGGSGRWMWELYRRLKEDADVHVAAAEMAATESFDQGAELPIHRIPLRFPNWGVWDFRGSWHYARAFVRLSQIVSRVRPDVIHCGKCLPEGLLALAIQRARGIPYYAYAHGEELTLARTSRELQRLTGRVLRHARRVIANSQFTHELLVREWGLAPEAAVVMHPGVDTRRFVPAPINPLLRQQWGWANRKVILTVGALQKRKGQDMLIQALPAIRRRCPDVLYAIAGEGWERSYLESLVRQHSVDDIVQFRGVPTEDELVQVYQQCDLFVLPNRRIGWDVEGFGIVLLEAQACGKPVIAGTSGGTAETLDAGVTGQLVPCEAPDTLADAVIRLLTGQEHIRTMGERARPFVVARFDWTVLRQRALQIFGESPAVAGARSMVV